MNNRAKVLFYTDDCACDSCDQIKECAHIDLGIINFVWIICIDCLNEYKIGSYSEKKMRRKKLKKINKLCVGADHQEHQE